MENEKVKSLLREMYPSFFNSIEKGKEEELVTLLDKGFTPYFSFYGENNVLHPLISWYGFYGKSGKGKINLVICTGKEYTVYKDGKKIGVFVTLEDIFNLFNLNSYSATMPKIYSDFLLFDEGKLGAILRKAKTLMDDEEWNQMVEFAAMSQWDETLRFNSKANLSETNSFKEFEKQVKEQKQLFDGFTHIASSIGSNTAPKPIIKNVTEKCEKEPISEA